LDLVERLRSDFLTQSAYIIVSDIKFDVTPRSAQGYHSTDFRLRLLSVLEEIQKPGKILQLVTTLQESGIFSA